MVEVVIVMVVDEVRVEVVVLVVVEDVVLVVVATLKMIGNL